MAVKVYGPATAVCPQRVMVCLLEKGVEFDLVHVDLDSGEQKLPEFLLKQPFGQVPVVEDGDFRLYESRAIIRYYAAKYEDRGTKSTGLHTRRESSESGSKVTPTWSKLSRRKLEKVLDVYEKRLSRSKYLAGESFTLADLSHMPATRYLISEAGLGHLVKDRKKLNAWWEDISSRPSWKKMIDLAGF
ncbi:GLUTATHIONE S-TRANSFERASE F12 [Salix koriyanagi]|uniref:glutathione transferase n=1 Tax=Salix koriyanagi TaxID=2511006 RepID=A0A9Q0VQ80_9ROSI|nr:GLUTATHIONE S-TRANSFERASE F12 [Salix koriyanagi]